MEKISSHWVAVQDDNKNPLELLFLFDDTPIDGGSSDPVTVEPARREKLAFLIVNLPIVGRSFGGHIVIHIGSHGTHYFSFDQPRTDRDESHLMPLRSSHHLLFCAVIVEGYLSRSPMIEIAYSTRYS